MAALIYYFFALFLLFHFLSKLLFRVNKKLPPSPGLRLPLLGHLHLLKKPLHRTLAKISRQHGPILYLWFGSRPVLVISSPSAAEECFSKNDVTFANRPRLSAGKHLGSDYTSLVWASYGHHWRNLRRIAMVELLSANPIQMFSNIRADEVKSLIGQIYQAGSERDGFRTVEMKSMFFQLTLNLMMRTIAGKRYYGEDVEEMEKAREFKEIVSETFKVSGVTNMVDFVPFLKWIGPNRMEKRLANLQSKRERFMQNLIEEHRRTAMKDSSTPEEKSKTMIQVLLRLQQTDPEYYTDTLIRGLMQVMLSAGTDTTAGTMEWALSLLLNNPDAIVKAQAELDVQVGETRLIEESDLPNLPYLQGIIKETLRMYPVGPLLVPHESSHDCTIGGYHIPGGTMLLVNAWAMHNDPDLWEEASEFKPERFKSWEDEKMKGFELLPFGAGRRGCPGESLGMRIMMVALGALIQCFEWERCGNGMVEMTEGFGLTMPKAHPLVAKCRPRQPMLNLLSALYQAPVIVV